MNVVVRTKVLPFCLGLLLLLAVACGDRQHKDVPEDAIPPESIDNPASASGNGEGESLLPVFSFREESFDFGSIAEGESVTHDYSFRNTGKSDLLISSASGSCGCTVPEYPKKAVAPGDDGVIRVTFNSNGKSGMQHKTVTLIANTVPNSKVLTITGEVTPKK
jgi:hypothetical protein